MQESQLSITNNDTFNWTDVLLAAKLKMRSNVAIVRCVSVKRLLLKSRNIWRRFENANWVHVHFSCIASSTSLTDRTMDPQTWIVLMSMSSALHWFGCNYTMVLCWYQQPNSKTKSIKLRWMCTKLLANAVYEYLIYGHCSLGSLCATEVPALHPSHM